MPELQEVPENTFLCATEGSHVGAGGSPAEHCDESHDQKFAEVVAGIAGPWVGDVVEGGEEDLQGTGTSGRVNAGSRIHIMSKPKGGRSARKSNAIPLTASS